jgi:hypothetical protein
VGGIGIPLGQGNGSEVQAEMVSVDVQVGEPSDAVERVGGR